jgi:ER lumen protein retaining receptor
VTRQLYVEAVSVLPQLRMMQRAKVVERFTANYVFALGGAVQVEYSLPIA